MVRDAYANYVVQTTLDVVADEREKHMLMEELHSHAAELVRSDFNLIRSFEIFCHLQCIPPSLEKLYICQAHCHEAGILVTGRHPIAKYIPIDSCFYNDSDSSFDGAIFR